MITPQPQNNNQYAYDANPADTQPTDIKIDNGYNDEENSSSVFGRITQLAYDIIAFIPKKGRSFINSIHDKIQDTIHARKVRAMKVKNALNIARAKAVCPFMGNSNLMQGTLDHEQANLMLNKAVLNHRHALVITELKQRLQCAKSCNPVEIILEKKSSHTKKAIAEVDKRTVVTDRAKKEFQLKRKYRQLRSELEELEEQKEALFLENKNIRLQMRNIDLDKDNDMTMTKELLANFEGNKSKIDDLESQIESKNEALNNARRAYKKHIGVPDTLIKIKEYPETEGLETEAKVKEDSETEAKVKEDSETEAKVKEDSETGAKVKEDSETGAKVKEDSMVGAFLDIDVESLTGDPTAPNKSYKTP